MQQAYEESHVVVADRLVLDFFSVAGDAKRVLYFVLVFVFSDLIAIDLLVENSGFLDSQVVAQVEAILLLDFVHFMDSAETHSV